MVQKTEKAPDPGARPRRGRPRAYDPATALARAAAAFWDAGYAATSLDDLCAATGMNRPSLYGAFGDKHAIYGRALEHYMTEARVAMGEALAADQPLGEALRKFYRVALGFYFSGEGRARGCFLIGTALTEAVGDDAVRHALAAALREVDRALEARIGRAQAAGELPADADPAILGKLAAALLYYLAIRSRAGEPRAALEAFAESGIGMICGGAPSPGARAAKRHGKGEGRR